MTPYTCRDVRDRLWDLLDGDLGAAEQAEMDRHLATCEACRREMAVRREVWGLLDLDAAPAGRDLTQRILNRVAAQAPPRARRHWRRWAVAAAAACAALALTLTLARRPPETIEPFHLHEPYLETQLVSLDLVSDVELLVYVDFLETLAEEETPDNGT